MRNRLVAIPGYVAKHLTWPLVLMTSVGSWRVFCDASRDGAICTLLSTWLAICLGLLALGQMSPIDLRFYLAMFQAMAVLAALSVGPAWRAGRWQRASGLGLAVWFASASLAYWFSWFGPVVPK